MQAGGTTFSLLPYQNEEGKWIPCAIITLGEHEGNREIKIEAPEFKYDDKKDAEQHALYLVKDYGVNNKD